MSSPHPEGSSNAENRLTPAELDDLNRLEATARHDLGAYLEVGDALVEIRDRRLYRDTHATFEAYTHERWGINIPSGDPLSPPAVYADTSATSTVRPASRAPVRSAPCEALADACEQTLAALTDSERMGIEIRLAVRKPGAPGSPQSRQRWDPREVGVDDLLPMLRWRLSQASGTIGEVAYQLETHAADIDDGARAQLQDDLLILDDELNNVKALLFEHIDWDSELRRLLDGEGPRDPDSDPDD